MNYLSIRCLAAIVATVITACGFIGISGFSRVDDRGLPTITLPRVVVFASRVA